MLFSELEIPEEEFSFGRSKIFIRNPRTVSEKCLPLQNQAIFHKDGLLSTASFTSGSLQIFLDSVL